MAHLTIELRVDPQTRKKDVVIHYHSDADALPMEHEEEHRRLVEKLIEGGALKAGEVGKIVVERESEAPPAGEATAREETARESIKQGS